MKPKGLRPLVSQTPGDPEVRKVLSVLDELLGKLPADVIEKFSKRQEYELYCKVLKRYGVE